MKNLIIFGGDGVGMIAASIAESSGKYIVKGFLNDYLPIHSNIGRYKKHKVIGSSQDYLKFLDDQNNFFFYGYLGMGAEKITFNKLLEIKIPTKRYVNLIHPTASIPWDYVNIGNGILMGPQAQLSPDTEISDNCIILGGAFIGHDSFMDRFSHVATNGVIGGRVHIGKGVHIGSNSTVREKVRIGDFSLVGCGSNVLVDIPNLSTVVGNPAKPLNKNIGK